jgi:hypothetical protein
MGDRTRHFQCRVRAPKVQLHVPLLDAAMMRHNNCTTASARRLLPARFFGIMG